MRLPRRGDRDPERLVYGLMALLALIVIYLVAFVLSNTEPVPVSFVLFDTTASLIWVMLVCTILGLVAGVAIFRLVAGRGRSRRAEPPGPQSSRPARRATPGSMSPGAQAENASRSSSRPPPSM